MKPLRNSAIVATGLALMLIGDAPPQAPLPFQVISESHAIFGVWRRTARRVAVVDTTVVASTAVAASASATAAAEASAAAAQQQAAAAHQSAAGALPLGTVVSSLPGGCTSAPAGGVEYYHCGGNFYRAMFQGNTLVYVTAQPK